MLPDIGANCPALGGTVPNLTSMLTSHVPYVFEIVEYAAQIKPRSVFMPN